MRKQNTTQRGTLLLLLALGVFIMMFPFLWTFITSITPNGSLSAGPSLIVKNPTWDAYRQLFATLPMGRIILNSVFVTVISTVLQLITGSMAGYAFARLEFPGKKVLFSLYLATMMIPLQVLITPLFTLFKDLNLHDTYFALIAPTVTSVFGVFMLRQAIQAVPKELDEAATIDGAGHLQIFGRIILPLIDSGCHGIHEHMEQLPMATGCHSVTRIPDITSWPVRTSRPVHNRVEYRHGGFRHLNHSNRGVLSICATLHHRRCSSQRSEIGHLHNTKKGKPDAKQGHSKRCAAACIISCIRRLRPRVCHAKRQRNIRFRRRNHSPLHELLSKWGT